MTTIVIQKDAQNAYRQIVCMGHAGYGKKHLFYREPDILCSAISILVLNTLNSLEELARESIQVVADENTGFIKCDISGGLQEKSSFLLDSMVFGLEQLQKQYGEEYLQVKFEEV